MRRGRPLAVPGANAKRKAKTASAGAEVRMSIQEDLEAELELGELSAVPNATVPRAAKA